MGPCRGDFEGLRVPEGGKFRGWFSEAASVAGTQVFIFPESLAVQCQGVFGTRLSGLPASAFPSVEWSWLLGKRAEAHRTEVGHLRRPPEVRKAQQEAAAETRTAGWWREEDGSSLAADSAALPA